MAEQDIQIRVGVEGADAAARQLGGVTDALHAEATAATEADAAHDAAGSSMAEMARGGTQFVQRVQGMASAIQGLVGALGSRDRTAGLVASIAGTTAQFAAMGATLGPAGAVIGGLVGLTTSMLSAADAARTVTHSVEEMNAELERRARVDAATIGERSWAHLMELRREEERAAADAADRMLTGMMAEAEADLARPRGGGRTSNAEAGFGAAMTEDALDLYTSDLSDAEIERRRARDEEFAAMDAERFEATMEGLAAEEEARKEADERALDAEQEKQDAIAEMHSERLEQQAQNEERVRQESIAQQEEFMNLGMNVVGLMTDALGEIASGEKTAEEAFKGLAKSFLQMISQYTALKAATEFADAIASFARYDFSGGAQHLAAGVAFTAVSVATGVGAAAINTSKPAAPARPEADRGDSGGKGGGDVIINWNSPVVTAGTRDDLGRELGALVRAGDARYGAA